MALYRDSRITPNESILGEVNFRLFEATSCGCLVLSQDLGDEQEALFEPGREFDTYENAVELDEKLSLYMKNSRLVRTMGRAARERVLAEHLPIHRAQRLLDFAGDCVRNRVTGTKAEEWEGLVRAAMWEAGVLETSPMDVLARLSKLEPEADVAATIVRMLAVSGLTSALEANIRAILGSRLHGDSLDVNLVGTMAALRLDQWDMAKAFWYRQSQISGRPPAAPPQTPLDILTLWAKELKRHGRVVRVGFSFDPRYNLPFSAVECLMTLLREEPEHLPTLKFLDSLLRSMTGFEQLRVGFLSIITLHERNDWRAAQEIALADLKSYRLESGLEELCLAQDLAARKGEMERFDKALSARDRSGALGRRLATFSR